MARRKNDLSAVRIERLLGEIRRRRVQAMLITDPVDVGHLSGFTGDDSWLLVGNGRPCLLTDFRYAEQAERECPHLARVVRTKSMIEALAAVVRKRRVSALGFEPESVTVGLRARLAKGLGRRVRLAAVRGVLSDLRIRKDESEVCAIRRAVAVAESAFNEFRRCVRIGMAERRLAAELDHRMRLAGADAPAFPTIVAVDRSAAMPHYRPGDRRLRQGSVLLVDFGARVGGYVCDLTRVLFAGRIRPHVASVYALVQEAQAAAIEAARPGAALVEVDAAARSRIEAAGFGRQFRHGTGHGLGRQVHEAPALARGVKGRLEPGMVVTIEPGIYLTGRFGVRIEDDVLITPGGPEVLTHLAKDPQAMVLDI